MKTRLAYPFICSRRREEADAKVARQLPPPRVGGYGSAPRHQGFILVAVLVLVMLISMIAISLMYQLKAADTAVSAGASAEQAWSAAMSGVQEAVRVARAAKPGVNDWEENAVAFKDRLVFDDVSERWYFTVYSPAATDDALSDMRYGLTSEAGKLNINAAHTTNLTHLPRMTVPLIAALRDFVDWDSDVRPEGAEQEYYDSLPRPYTIRNGPLDTLDELLLVRGFTPSLLYGEDSNMNWRLDLNENDGDERFPPDNADGKLDRGLSQFLTVASYDPNEDHEGIPRTNLNLQNDPLPQVDLPGPLTNFIHQLRTNKQHLAHPVDLLDATLVWTNATGIKNELASGVGKDQLPLVLDLFTTSDESKFTGLIDVNTASIAVLRTVQGIDEPLAESIVSGRRSISPERRGTLAWLLQEGVVDVPKFKEIAPFFTARTLQFSFHVVGYGVPSGRYRVLEVIIDVGGDEPRIVYLRDLTKLGMPFPLTGPEVTTTANTGAAMFSSGQFADRRVGRVAKASLQNLIKLPSLGRKRRSRGPSQSTGLVVEGQMLRVVQATVSGSKTTIQRVASAPLEFPADADVADPNVIGPAIARALKKLEIKPGAVVMGVPRAQVVLRTLTVPVIEDVRELASMVHLQVSKDLPFRMDEAVVDFKVRRKIVPPAPRVDGDAKAEVDAPLPKLEVLVAAAKRSLVESVEQTAAAAGLKLCALGLLPYANVRALDAFKLVDDEQAVALVSLRPDEMNIDVIAQQTLLFSRGASAKLPGDKLATSETPAPKADAPSSDTTSFIRPESFAELVTIEVVRSLHAFSGVEPNRSVARVAVSGVTGHEASVVEAIEKRLNRPCTLLDPGTVFELPAEAREHVAGALPAIGLALGCGDESGLPFDFLNPKKPAVQRDMRRIRILAGAAAVVALFIFTLAIRQFLINRHQKVLTQLQAQFSNEDKQRKTFQAMARHAGVVRAWTEGGRNWLDHYAYLSAVLPASEEIYITSLSVGGTGLIRLTVQARSGETLAKLDKQLRAAGYDVKPIAITPGADRHGYEFRSTVELTIPAKQMIDLSKVKTPARPADDVSLDPAFNKGGGG